ncbi:MAG: magnesium/cobalt efflux protein, partial [Burkholderiales bacterium]
MSESPRPTLLQRVSALVAREPEDRDGLLQLLRSAYKRGLIDAEALSIIEGAMAVAELQVRDIMIPLAQVDVIDINDPPDKF